MAELASTLTYDYDAEIGELVTCSFEFTEDGPCLVSAKLTCGVELYGLFSAIKGRVEHIEWLAARHFEKQDAEDRAEAAWEARKAWREAA
jgi:hypothetical protein